MRNTIIKIGEKLSIKHHLNYHGIKNFLNDYSNEILALPLYEKEFVEWYIINKWEHPLLKGIEDAYEYWKNLKK